MPGILNSESRQVTHDSQGLRVTVRISDDSTSNSNNNTADDSTLGPTNNNHADDLTSTSPPVVPIGRGGRLARPNNVSNPSPVGRGVGRCVGRGGRVPPPSHQLGWAANPETYYRLMARITAHEDLVDDSTSLRFGRNASNNLFVGRGVGQGQTNAQPSTSAPRVGREVGRGAVRGGIYFHPYWRPAVQTSASTNNGTCSSSVIFLDSDGEEVEEEEENFVRSNDDRHQFSYIENLFNRRRLVFDINERYAES